MTLTLSRPKAALRFHSLVLRAAVLLVVIAQSAAITQDRLHAKSAPGKLLRNGSLIAKARAGVLQKGPGIQNARDLSID